jgi:hypothetical protein
MTKSKDEIELELYKHLSDRPDDVGDLAMSARAKVLKMAPGCNELIYNSYAVSNVFTFTEKLGQAFIHIATYANHVNLGFNRGVLLDDESEILKGTGKMIRHIRLESKSTIKQKAVTELIRLAIEQGKELAANGR